MMDYLQGAKGFANQMDGDIPGEQGARNAQRAMALALIGIAEELRRMNERAEEWPGEVEVDQGIVADILEKEGLSPFLDDDLPF